MTWYPLQPADASFFDTAPVVERFPVRLAVPPARVWESLASDGSLADWPLGLRRLSWTSPRPFGVGTTREVVLPLAAMTLREEFFRWEDGARYSFHVRAATRRLFTRFAEDYTVEPDGAGTLFTWTIALEPAPGWAGVLRRAGRVNRRAFGLVPRAAARYFARYP